VDMRSAVQAIKLKKLTHGSFPGASFIPSAASDSSASWEKKQMIPDKDQDQDKDKDKDSGDKEKDIVPPAPPPIVYYYPALPAVVVPIAAATAGQVTIIPVGTLVQCQVVANLYLQRLPLYVCNVTPLSTPQSQSQSQVQVQSGVASTSTNISTSNSIISTSTSGDSSGVTGVSSSLSSLLVAAAEVAPDSDGSGTGGRVKGTIIRLKINTTLGFDVSEITLNEQYRQARIGVTGGESLFAISSSGSSSGSGEDVNYYCDTRELRGGDSNTSGGRDKSSGSTSPPPVVAHVGDIVEFLPVNGGHCIAACPSLAKVSSSSSSSSDSNSCNNSSNSSSSSSSNSSNSSISSSSSNRSCSSRSSSSSSSSTGWEKEDGLWS
jgi:hypothetical protein